MTVDLRSIDVTWWGVCAVLVAAVVSCVRAFHTPADQQIVRPTHDDDPDPERRAA